MPRSTLTPWKIVVLIFFLLIIAIAASLAAIFSGLSAFDGDNNSNTNTSSVSSEAEPPLIEVGPRNNRVRVYRDNLLLNPYYLRDVIHGMTLVLTENNQKLGNCFEGCFTRFFMCPDSDQRDECEKEALILRECPSHTLCIKECLDECDRYGISYPRTEFRGSQCVDFINAKAICP